MEKRRSAQALRHMRTLFGVGAVGGLSDGVLLDQFSSGHREGAEAAFATLVERHGPMVLRVCRGVLGDSHDVHDAFQATFLVLVRKAGSLWVRDSLASWLHGVALRVASKAKVAAARRKAHRAPGAEVATAARGGNTPDELVTALHDEVERLPAKYRAPIVLCYLEGLTHEGAATALGWPVGTVRGRLARARDLLRSRIVRRGLAPSAEAFAAILSAEEASAAPLPESLVQAVLALVAERSAGVAPAAVAALAEGVLRMMTMAKLKTASILVLFGLVALGLTEAARSRLSGSDQAAAAPPAPPVQAAAQPAKAPAEPAKAGPETWPADTLVRGRVVDHRGAAVAGADVLLLGSETLTVYVNPGPREGTVRYSISTRPAGPPPSVKTDGQGRFSLRRPASPADRIAVVSESMLLWEVTSKEVPDANDFVIALPEPGELSIRAEVPEKQGKQEYWIVGRPTSRVDWESDSVFYRGIEVPNPGERVVRPLPPAQYAVERINFTPQGVRSNLMTPCERRLLRVEPGKRTEATYDRTTGRPVEGRVRGLEQVKLRYGAVTIGYWGPEERFKPGAKTSKIMTHFDVIPISSDGRFTTPPLPPNRYDFQLAAMRATTPVESNQGYDFGGSATVVIPETGDIPPVEIVAKSHEARPAARAKAPDPKKPRLEIHARDESGAPVKEFEAQLYGPPNASPEAAIGTDGRAVLAGDDLKSWNHGDLIVYAPGFASTIEEIGPIEGLKQGRRHPQAGDEGSPASAGRHGQAGRARGHAAAPGLPAPVQERRLVLVRGEESREALPGRRRDQLPQRPPRGRGRLRVPRPYRPAHAALLCLQPPGRAPLLRDRAHARPRNSPAASGTSSCPSPRRSSLALKSPQGADGKSLFAAGYYMLSPLISDKAVGLPVLVSGELNEPQWRTRLGRLAPGAYDVHIQTTSREAPARPPDLEARRGCIATCARSS